MKYILNDIAPIQQGHVSDSDKYWLLNLDMVEGNTGRIINYVYSTLDEIGASTVKFDTKNVLYSKLRPYLNKVVLPEKEGYATSEMLPLRPNTQIITREYLTYFLRSKHFVEYINEKVSGAKMPRANTADLKAVEIDCPNLEVQKRITSELDKLVAIISFRQQELQRLDDLIKARFVELFGDTVTNPLGWEEHRLDEYIEFLTSGSRGWAQYFVDEENELFITIKNVKNNHITLDNIQYIDAPSNKEAERTKVKTGDLLISITADLGRTGVVDSNIAEKGAYINQHLSLVRLNKDRINPLYVSYFLETKGGKMQFDSKNQNGVKAGLNFEAIKSLKILVPPLEMQEAYLDFVAQTDKSKFLVLEYLSKQYIIIVYKYHHIDS